MTPTLCAPARLVFAALLVLSTAASSMEASVDDARLRVFISDLHLGVGRLENGAWHNMEDFRWASDFASFLDAIDKLGNGATDLIVVGDAFELWQSTARDCVYADKDLSCTEAEALARLNRVVANHDAELTALGTFALKGDNRVVIIPGNHDAGLLFAPVARRAVAATGAAKRVTVAAAGIWISPDGAIVAEHGHQIGMEVNKFDGWPKPFVGTPPHLRRPWGEQFVQKYYNAFEEEFPIIDNILSESIGIYYAIKAKGVGAVADVGRLGSFLLTQMSWAQFGGALGPDAAGSGGNPDWDIAAVRARGRKFLVDSFPAGDPVRLAMEQAMKSGTIPEPTDSDLRELCDARAALNAPNPIVRLLDPPEFCPTGNLGAAGQFALRRSRDRILREHLLERSRDLLNNRPFHLFVYGHTHAAESDFDPMEGTRADWHPKAINTGAWHRVVHPEKLEKWRAQGRSHEDALKLDPSRLPPCYSFVVVEPYRGTPVAKLQYWTVNQNKGQIAGSCSADIQ